jgi:hypothetical protein
MRPTEAGSNPGDDRFPMTITQSRCKAATDVLWALVIGALSLSQYNSSLLHPRAWSYVLDPIDMLAIAVCGLWAISSVIEIVRPPRLILDSQGITERSLFRAHTIPWDEVENFRSVRVVPFWPTKLIKFDYHRPRAVHPVLRAVARYSGTGSTLGPGCTMKAERLAALLNGARRHWAGSPQSG